MAPALFRRDTDVLPASEERKQTRLDSHLILCFLFPTLLEYTRSTDRAEMLSQGRAVCVFPFLRSLKAATMAIVFSAEIKAGNSLSH